MGSGIGGQPLRTLSPRMPLRCEDGISWLRCRITGEEKESSGGSDHHFVVVVVLFVSDPEWRWMEADSAFTLPFPDPSATSCNHLLPDGSRPPHPVFHRSSINSSLDHSSQNL